MMNTWNVIGCFASMQEYVHGTPTVPASSRLLDVCCLCSSASLRPTSRSDTVSLAADAACFADFEDCFFGLAAFLPFAGALLLALPCFPTCSHPLKYLDCTFWCKETSTGLHACKTGACIARSNKGSVGRTQCQTQSVQRMTGLRSSI